MISVTTSARLFGHLLCLSVLVMLPAVAAAQQDLVHDCGTGKLGDTIGDFIDKTQVNTLTINGTCDTSENPFATGTTVRNSFIIAGFTNLTIKAGAGGATLSAASDACTPGANPPPGGFVLQIFDSGRIALENLQITGGRGLAVTNSTVVTNRPANAGNTFSGSRTTGISLMDGSNLTLKSVDLVQNNCQHGVVVIGNSSLISSATIRNNGDTGVNASAPAAVTLPGGSKIHDNGTAGVVYSGPGRVQLAGTEVYANGLAPVGVNASNPGGVVAILGALAQLVGANVHDNGGSGVYLRLNSTGLLTNTTVQSNPSGGLNLNQGSMAELSVLVGPNVLQGNGGGGIGDVNCDAYSQVFGDVSGVASNKCRLKGGK
jgi:hypothetical protein